ncbi:Adenylate cyclase [Nocardioides sp. AX2bis]|nr:Adenylate cyclase [Nocardioides sp. AX2bis]
MRVCLFRHSRVKRAQRYPDRVVVPNPPLPDPVPTPAEPPRVPLPQGRPRYDRATPADCRVGTPRRQ